MPISIPKQRRLKTQCSGQGAMVVQRCRLAACVTTSTTACEVVESWRHGLSVLASVLARQKVYTNLRQRGQCMCAWVYIYKHSIVSKSLLPVGVVASVNSSCFVMGRSDPHAHSQRIVCEGSQLLASSYLPLHVQL